MELLLNAAGYQAYVIGGSYISRAGFQDKEIRNVLQNCLEYCFYHPDQNNREFYCHI
ncbi:MAG: hypothetical protein ACOX1W_03345 [Catenisphaera adipataccumulans]|uniref:hypothetical protein n=1 Tax=Catenisphaera adipataccumulans TaxID=700500 RepID=UPI003D919900